MYVSERSNESLQEPCVWFNEEKKNLMRDLGIMEMDEYDGEKVNKGVGEGDRRVVQTRSQMEIHSVVQSQ